MNCLTLTLTLTVTEYINLHKNTNIFHISGLMPMPNVRESDYTTLRRRTYGTKGLLQSSVAKTMVKKVLLLVFRLFFLYYYYSGVGWPSGFALHRMEEDSLAVRGFPKKEEKNF